MKVLLTTVPDVEKGIGIAFASPDKLFERETKNYNLLEAIPAGVSEAYQQMVAMPTS